MASSSRQESVLLHNGWQRPADVVPLLNLVPFRMSINFGSRLAKFLVCSGTCKALLPRPGLPCHKDSTSVSAMDSSIADSEPQNRLENARRPLLRQAGLDTPEYSRKAFYNPPKQVWPQGADFIRKESTPEGYEGRVAMIHALNRHKQKVAQLYHIPTKRPQSQMKSRVRQSEVKEAADKAVAEERRRRQGSEESTEEETPVPGKTSPVDATASEEADAPTEHVNDEPDTEWTVVKSKRMWGNKRITEL